jgi:hypothetical protein
MRWVLRCKTDPPPRGDVARIRALRGVRVLDEASPRLLLVEADADAAKALAAALPGWTVAPDSGMRLPESPPRVEPGPGRGSRT